MLVLFQQRRPAIGGDQSYTAAAKGTTSFLMFADCLFATMGGGRMFARKGRIKKKERMAPSFLSKHTAKISTPGHTLFLQVRFTLQHYCSSVS
ncbi:hypothetical protein EGT74_00140 [Chitinophaga lutea]|uniref:Uncharacterized protein n=1 Tax=Chitinophaga lutea TaxID=2488634 RepID=A0A3N4PTP0_9BACT|nr:hypothetical protein EGT74_00140 [Chitinophaga lutea]